MNAIDFTRTSDWKADPKHLLFVLARYKFVAKMLEGFSQVLEVGCGDAFASAVVRQHVGNLVCTDIDPALIGIAVARDKPYPGEYRCHDMVKAPLYLTDYPMLGRFTAAYSLDVLEHIRPEDEPAFLKNLADSVDRVAIIGTPSLESQPYASENSRRGHINCKTAGQLRDAIREHFGTVFCFGMNDETLTTGFEAMRHYNFCVGVK